MQALPSLKSSVHQHSPAAHHNSLQTLNHLTPRALTKVDESPQRNIMTPIGKVSLMQTLVLNKDSVTKQSHLTKQPSPHPLSSYINKVSTSLNLGSNDTYNGKKGQILGQHHDSRGLIDCLRPSVKNYAHPTLAEHFSSEKMKQFQSLEDSDRDCHQLTVK